MYHRGHRLVTPLVLFLAAAVTTRGAEIPEDAIAKITAAAPAKATARPAKARRLLVFTLAKGFKHSSIPFAAEALRIIGEKTGAYSTVISDDVALFRPDSLRQFDAVCMDNTTGTPFDDPALKQSLLTFVEDGGGLIGIHAATDCFYNWPEYGQLMGGYFAGHPWNETVTVKVDDPEHPVVAAFNGRPFEVADEIYQFRDPYARDALRVLLSLDMTKTKAKGRRPDGDYAVSWVRAYGKGRVFYCSLGHRHEIFWNAPVLQHYLDGIQFAMGDLQGATKPVPLSWRSVDPYMGEYAGTCTLNGKETKAEAKVMAEGNGSYRAVVTAADSSFDLRAGGSGGGRLPVFTTAEGAQKGVNYAYYEGDWNSVPDFAALTPVQTGTAGYFDIGSRKRQDEFGFRFTGFFKIAEDGDYSFTLKSDDGSQLFIGDRKVVDHDGLHGADEKSGRISLRAGTHPITVNFFEKGGDEALDVTFAKVAMEGAGADGLPVAGSGLDRRWQGSLGNDHLVATAPGGGRIELTFHERQSPTLGLAPPAGAVRLLPTAADGSPSLAGWRNQSWRPVPDGSMEVGKGNNQTVADFGDIRLHLEFRCPYEPQGRGQARGNSGVYIQSRYEVQVLDSFGLNPGMGDCGAIYGVAIPKTNACLPPLNWQTYDIVFQAARFGPDGKVTQAPKFLSVKLNGVTIQQNQEVPGATRAAGARGATATAPLMLQDHGHRVRYRNIWIAEQK